MIYSNVRIEMVERLINSVNGNPRFLLSLHHADGEITTHKTQSDAACSYEVTNYVNSKAPAVVEITPAGNIRTIRPWKP